MSTAVVDEFVNRARSVLSVDEQKDLSRRLNEPEPRTETHPEVKKNGKNGYVSPNTIWMRENSYKYRGMYVAIKDGEFIATGRTIKEADIAAKEKGVDRPFLAYFPGEDEEIWGGW